MSEYPESDFVGEALSGLIDAKRMVSETEAQSVVASQEEPSTEQVIEEGLEPDAAASAGTDNEFSIDFSGLSSFLPPSSSDVKGEESDSAPAEKVVAEMSDKEKSRMNLLLKDAFTEDRKMWEANILELGGVDSSVSSRLEVYLEGHLTQWPAWEFLGFCYQVQGLYKYALRVYEYLIKSFPEEARYHYYLGNVLAFRKKRKEAMKHYAEALTCDPDGPVGTRALKKISNLKKKV
jgi:tetratricopeptide (TPR) repeat protein